MKKNSGLDFTSSPRKKSGGAAAAVIAVCVLIIGAVSFIILLAANDFDTAKFFGTRLSDTPTETEATIGETQVSVSAPEFSDSEAINFLFVCHDSSELSFCSVLSASVTENNIKIKALTPDTSFGSGNDKITVKDAFRQKGVAGIKDLLSKKGIHISKYVSVTETNFKLIMGKLGATEVELPRDIAFSDGGVKYTFPAGKNTFTADLILKLIKLGDTGDGQAALQSTVEAAIVRKNLTAANFDKGADFFSTLINPVDTDITAFDYSEASAAINGFILASPSVAAIG